MAAAATGRLPRRDDGSPPVPPPTPRPTRRQDKGHPPQPASVTRRFQALCRPDWAATSPARLPSPPQSPRRPLSGVGRRGVSPARSLPPPSLPGPNISRNSSPSPARRRQRPPLAHLSRSHEDARFMPTRSVSPMSSPSSKTLPHPPPRAVNQAGRPSAKPNFSTSRLDGGRIVSAIPPPCALGVSSHPTKGNRVNSRAVRQEVNSVSTLSLGPYYRREFFRKGPTRMHLVNLFTNDNDNQLDLRLIFYFCFRFVSWKNA